MSLVLPNSSPQFKLIQSPIRNFNIGNSSVGHNRYGLFAFSRISSLLICPSFSYRKNHTHSADSNSGRSTSLFLLLDLWVIPAAGSKSWSSSNFRRIRDIVLFFIGKSVLVYILRYMTRERMHEWRLGSTIQPLGHSLLGIYVIHTEEG